MSFPLEVELLLCCARTCMDKAMAERLRELLRQDINWECVIRTARLHGVIPLLSQNLHLTAPEAVPKAILDQLQRDVRANALHNFFLTKELLKLLALFDAHSIPAVPYKGPVLTMMVYANFALRQFNDLDILVHQQDVSRAKALLISQGYRLLEQHAVTQEAAHLRSFHAYCFVRDDNRVSVDLHWRFAQRWSYFAFPLDLNLLWERLEPFCLAGTTVLNLPPEEMLLVLCVHGTKDGWKQLKWICDIAELARVHQGMDWEWVMVQARRLHSERMLFLGLSLASHLLGATFPEAVMQRVRANPVVDRLATQVCQQIFAENPGAVSILLRSALHLRALEGWRDRISYVFYYFRMWITPGVMDFALLPLPKALSLLYYLIRPIRLVGTYGLTLVRYFLGHLHKADATNQGSPVP